MSSDHTQQQSSEDESRARELSLRQSRPPTTVQGYELSQLLGSGAYGEVWIGSDRTTGRDVAVKFFRHRQGVDWSLLSREVEKLVFLSADRYVVQLLGVGWDADPPYYVMEFMENGSLEDRLRREGTFSVDEAVDIFRETAIGLNHAHAKGVLHCDLKPANILLDQDSRPRLADFGQSRLSHEQQPSLGTLFYMAPEQADLTALPDAQWDVYALGAILYCMLVGEPPFHNDELITDIEQSASLVERLRCYREGVAASRQPGGHLRVSGIDSALVEIIDRCLAIDLRNRYANVQEVLDALRTRERVRVRRPLMLLGIIGPLLLLAVMAIFGWRGYVRALRDSDAAVTTKVAESNTFAAKFVAANVASEIEKYFRVVEANAADPALRQLVAEMVGQLNPMLEQLDDRQGEAESLELARKTFLQHAARRPLQEKVVNLLDDDRWPKVASWFICDVRGTQVAAVFDRETAPTIGHNFAYRSYFHGGSKDLSQDDPSRMEPVKHTHLSAPLKSTATGTLKMAVSTPIYSPTDPSQCIGVLALTVEVGNFLTFAGTDKQFAVLVEGRENGFRGAILHHPLFTRVFAENGFLPARYGEYRVDLDQPLGHEQLYWDPLADEPDGAQFKREWIAAKADVELHETNGDLSPSGLAVLVQEAKDAATAPVRQLGNRLVFEGLFALVGVLIVVFLLWYFVLRVLGEPGLRSANIRPSLNAAASPTPMHNRPTLPSPRVRK
jgi:serine/threonine protein kinase